MLNILREKWAIRYFYPKKWSITKRSGTYNSGGSDSFGFGGIFLPEKEKKAGIRGKKGENWKKITKYH